MSGTASPYRKRPGDGDGYQGDMKRPRSDKPPATLRMLVRNRDAGGIIGKAGENIKRLRKQYDCQVTLPDTSGSPERVLTVMGEAESCLGVMKEVLSILPAEGKGGEMETQVLIPQPFMGTIIGTGGSKIKDLRERVPATIKIFSEPMPGSNERSIQLIGGIDAIAECVRSFLDDISKKDCREPIYLYEPGAVEFDAPPPFFQDYSRGRGQRPRGGMRGRGSGFTPRGRGGPPPRFNQPPRAPQPSNVAPPTRPPQFNNTPAPVPPAAPLVPPTQAVAPPTSAPYNPPAPVGYTTPSNTSYIPPTPNPPPAPQQPRYPPLAPVPQSQAYVPPAQPPVPAHAAPPPAQSSQQVTIPMEYSDAILGPNGSRLAGIKAQSSCEITLNPPNPGTNERVITIVGTTQGIQMAQQLMQNSVRQFHPNV